MDDGATSVDIAPSGNDPAVTESPAQDLGQSLGSDSGESRIASYGSLTVGNLLGLTSRSVQLVTRDELLVQLRDDVADLWQVIIAFLAVFFALLIFRR